MSIERIKSTAEQIMSRLNAVKGRGEEATKQAMVMPMLQAMGYDIWNPEEVCPEYDADFAIKKMGQKEKVDIAIMKDGKPAIFIEVKSADIKLDGHQGQLARYYNFDTAVSLAILTNGIEWWLYTDTAEPNRMDERPFHVCNMDAAEQGLDVLARFCKETFDGNVICDYATELKYTALIAKFLRENLDLRERDPEENFIRWILTELKDKGGYQGMIFATVVNRFRPIVKAALTRTVREIVRRSISAMDEEAAPVIAQPAPAATIAEEVINTPTTSIPIRTIVTTDDELALYAAIEEIFNHSSFKNGTINEPGRRREIPIELGFKDTTAYFGIYFNKPGWWFLRAMLDGNNKWLGFDLPADIGAPLIPEQIKILPKTAFASIRVAFNGLEDLRLLEPVILAAMEHNVRQRATAQEVEDGGEQASAPEAPGNM